MSKKIVFISLIVVVIGVGITMLHSCKGCSSKNDIGDLPPDSIMSKGSKNVSDKTMVSIIENLSSPVEIAAMIKTMGVPFSKSFLASTDYMSTYTTSYSQAFAMGMFGADLGYLNMYGKTGSVMDYISSIKNLADQINVGQFFDFSTLKRLATNNGNIDSLKYISVHSFNEMDKYLRSKGRGNLSALMIAGVWVEGLYLAIQVSKQRNDPRLQEKIGEQKIILADLLILLRNYSNDPMFKKYVEDFEKIKARYNDVKITYEMGEPQPVEENGMLTIKQTEKSVVHVTEEQMKSITETIESVRNKLIKM